MNEPTSYVASSFITMLLFILTPVVVATAVSPRAFLEGLGTCSVGGTYSVMPIVNNYVLDFNFHVDRICSGFETLSGDCVDRSTFHTQILNAVYEARIRASLATQLPKRTSGIATVAIYKDAKEDEMCISALYTAVNISTYTSMSPWPRFVADVHYFQRSRPNVKDMMWPKTRKIIESRRMHSSIDESLLLRKNINSFDDAFTEGLVSNFFIIDNDYNVMTCPNSFVLPGSMSKIVKNICIDCGFNVIERPPLLSEIRQWKSAFLVSSSKPIWILKGLYLPSQCEQVYDGHKANYYSLLGQYDKRSNEIIISIQQKLSKLFMDAVDGRHPKEIFGTSWSLIG